MSNIQTTLLEIEQTTGDVDMEINEYNKINVNSLIYSNVLVKQNDGVLLFNPFNPLNVQITPLELSELLKEFGLDGKYYNFNIYRRAFVHESYVKHPSFQTNNVKIAEKPDNCLSLSSKSNERLEFLGDGVLELITKFIIYRRFGKASEGFMTDVKIKIVKNEAIGKLAEKIGLNKWMIMSKHNEENNQRTNHKKLGCLFEAFIGAIFVDNNHTKMNDIFNDDDLERVCDLTTGLSEFSGLGFQKAQVFVENVFDKYLDWQKIIKQNDNYKTIFQQIIQKKYATVPIYNLLSQDPSYGFYVGVYLSLNNKQLITEAMYNNCKKIESFNNSAEFNKYVNESESVLIMLGTGKGKLKVNAEQNACENAMKYAGLISG